MVFGAGHIDVRNSERPLLQIWRLVGDTTYTLVRQSTLELEPVPSRGAMSIFCPLPSLFELVI